jgi:hypothetical protein
MTRHADASCSSRRAVYALAELVWQQWPASRVDTEASLWSKPRVTVQLVALPCAAAAEEMVRALPGVTVHRVQHQTRQETSWLRADATWQGVALLLTVFHTAGEA